MSYKKFLYPDDVDERAFVTYVKHEKDDSFFMLEQSVIIHDGSKTIYLDFDLFTNTTEEERQAKLKAALELRAAFGRVFDNLQFAELPSIANQNIS